jgi:hypothetical protein
MKINKLPEKLETTMFSMMNICDKLILGGSSVLHMLGVIGRTPHDLDFSLTERLTEHEFHHLVNFFDFKVNRDVKDYKEEYDNETGHMAVKEIKYTTAELLEKDLIQLVKYKLTDDIGIETTDFKIDIFNHKTVTKKNIVYVEYEGVHLKIAHPSYIIAAKAKYAFDPRISASYKHMTDLKEIMSEPRLTNYFRTTKSLLDTLPKVEIDL